jgi:AcrR family transcriptional regulator
MTQVASLRERQADYVRVVVLDSMIAALEKMNGDDLSMADIAKDAGISLRTLYRYFPDRASVLRAAGDHLYASEGVPLDIASPEDIAASFRHAAGRLGARPRLVRTLVYSGAGRAARSAVRDKRVEILSDALQPISEQLEPKQARRARAIITHLCSAAAWVTVADESGVSDGEAQEAVAWAINALVRTLREETRTGPTGTSNKAEEEQ